MSKLHTCGSFMPIVVRVSRLSGVLVPAPCPPLSDWGKRPIGAREEKQKMKERQTNEGYRQYLKSRHWKKLRRTLFKKQGRVCSVCSGVATDPHHVSYGKHLLRVNHQQLRPLCRECHDVIHWLIDTGKLVYRSKKVNSRWKQTMTTLADFGMLPEPDALPHGVDSED